MDQKTTTNVHLEIINLKQTEETEEQRKERLRIGHEKEQKKLQEEKKRLSETEDHQKQCLATLTRLK